MAPSTITLYCPECGVIRRPASTRNAACDACASTKQPTTGWVTPTREAALASIHPPHPWNEIKWDVGGVATLTGPQGVGKSSIAAKLHAPKLGTRIGGWMGVEMAPDRVYGMARRVGVEEAFPIKGLLDAVSGDTESALAALRRSLDEVTAPVGSFLVLDSVTPFRNGAVDALNYVIRTCRMNRWRAVVIVQTNKESEIAGSARLLFDPDINCRGDRDRFGRRMFRVPKNRYGPETSTYYQIKRDTGRIEEVQFGGRAHSVEGVFPNYELVPYGLAAGSVPGKAGKARGKAFQLAGLLDAFAELDLLAKFPNIASAAFASPATPLGFDEPPDIDDRRAFAESHGSQWLSIEAGYLLLSAAEEQEGQGEDKQDAAKQDAAKQDNAAKKRDDAAKKRRTTAARRLRLVDSAESNDDYNDDDPNEE